MTIVTPRGIQVHPPSSRINYKRRPTPSHSNTTLSSSQVLLLRRHLPSPSAAFYNPHRKRCEHSSGESRPPKPLQRWDHARDSGAIRFLGSVLTRLLTPWSTTSSTSRWPNECLRPRLPGGRTPTSSTSWWSYLCSPSEYQNRLDYFPTAICNASTKFGYIEQPWPTQCPVMGTAHPVPPHWSRLSVHYKPILVYYFVHIY